MQYSVHLCFFVLIIFGIDKGFCIECYICSSNDDEGCFKLDKNKIPLTKCNMKGLSKTKQYAEKIDQSFAKFYELDLQAQEPQVPMNCLKQITKVGGQETVLRGCQLAATEQLDICVRLKKLTSNNVHTSYCSLCNSDGCNSGQINHPEMVFTMILMVLSKLIFNY